MQEIHSILGKNCYYTAENGDRRPRQSEQTSNQALKCPRCDSQNTKFCYYNNYNMSQPRHYCKNCRRYWTKGGVLRNVPVGGGCRKGRRSKLRRISSSAETTALPQVEKQIDTENYNSSGESSNLTNTTPPAECQTFSECLGQGSNNWSFSDVGEFQFGQNHWLPPLIDQTLHIDSPVAGGYEPFDWKVTGDHLFDVADPVDRAFGIPDL